MIDQWSIYFKVEHPGDENEKIIIGAFFNKVLNPTPGPIDELADAVLEINGTLKAMRKNRFADTGDNHVSNSKFINAYENLMIRLYSNLWPNAIDKGSIENKRLL